MWREIFLRQQPWKEICFPFFPHTQNVVLSAADDKTFRAWDVGTGKCLHTFGIHRGAVKAVSVHPAWDYVLSASLDSVWMRILFPPTNQSINQSIDA